MSLDETEIRGYILENHHTTIESIMNCADRIEGSEPVKETLRHELESQNLYEDMLRVLEDVVEHHEIDLKASPVTKPPYIVVTSLGPILRISTSDRRIVLKIRVFNIKGRSEPPKNRYVRRGKTPSDVLEVEVIEKD